MEILKNSNDWTDKYKEETIFAIENNMFETEIGNVDTPLIPPDWNKKHGYVDAENPISYILTKDKL